MHCPNCGTQAAADQKFCRSCGIGLQAIAEALAKELATAGLDHSLDELSDPEKNRIKKFERWGATTALTGLAMIALMIIGIVVSMPFFKLFKIDPQFYFENVLPWVFAVALPTFLIGGGMAIYAGVRKKRIQHQQLQPPTLPKADTTSKLPAASHLEPVASIAERTTDLLEVADHKREQLKQ